MANQLNKYSKLETVFISDYIHVRVYMGKSYVILEWYIDNKSNKEKPVKKLLKTKSDQI